MATSDDITRYIRCNRLVVQVLTPLVRKYMQLTNVPPATVYHLIMQSNCQKFRAKLSQTQMSVIQTLLSDGYEKFDITLMYKIAREKCFRLIIKEHPSRQWGAEPLPHEITMGDDIERIRHCRDNIMHNPNHIVSESELNDIFDKFIEVGKRANTHLNLTDELSYEQQIRDLRKSPIDPETTRKLNETLMRNESLKEIMQLQRFQVFMEKDIVVYVEDIRRGNEPLDSKKRIRMVINGLTNPANLAETINSRREEIKLACKDCLIELDEASEGSLILYLEVHNRIFQSDELFHAEMDRFVEILFQVISLKPEIAISSYLLILQDDSYMSDSSSDEEDNSSLEGDQKKLVLDLIVQNKAFETDESLQQNLNSFVGAVITDMNGQQIKKNYAVSAVLKLHESEYAKSSQQILVCGLCEVDQRIKVKCFDCDLFLCQRCQYKAHAKFKNASSHDVVPLKDVPFHDNNRENVKEFIPEKCKNHSTKICCIYCVTCRQIVCEVCVAETHKMHNTEDIPSFCHKRIKKMKSIYSKTRYDVERIISGLRKMHEIQTNNYNAMERLLLKDKENAINKINSKYAELFSQYNENKIKCLELMCVKETALWKDEQFALKILDDVETLFETRDIPKFLGKTEYLETFLSDIPRLILEDGYNVHVQHFYPKPFHCRICSETLQTEIILKSKGFFICDISFVNTMTSDHDGTIWIADEENNIKQLEIRETVKTLKATQLDVAIEEIRCLRNNQIIFTSSTKIMQLTNEEVSELINFDPYEPSTIHVSNENEIIVGFNKHNTDDTGDPVIIRLGLNVENKQIYRNYESQLLQNDRVRSCTASANRDISFIDSCANDRRDGYIVNIDNNGIIQWKYHGNPVLNVADHPFCPIEVLTTRSNNLVISDVHEGALHILTPMGSLLTVVDVTHMGLPKVYTMTIDMSSTLWIHSQPRKRNSLCAFEYSGF